MRASRRTGLNSLRSLLIRYWHHGEPLRKRTLSNDLVVVRRSSINSGRVNRSIEDGDQRLMPCTALVSSITLVLIGGRTGISALDERERRRRAKLAAAYNLGVSEESAAVDGSEGPRRSVRGW